MMKYVKRKLYMVPLAELQTDPTHPRTYMDPEELDGLASSISKIGIIEPIVCRLDPSTGRIYTVAGTRRCAAAKKAGLTEVPAVFIEGENPALIALVENMARQDLTAVEEAEALGRLMNVPIGRR